MIRLKVTHFVINFLEKILSKLMNYRLYLYTLKLNNELSELLDKEEQEPLEFVIKKDAVKKKVGQWWRNGSIPGLHISSKPISAKQQAEYQQDYENLQKQTRLEDPKAFRNTGSGNHIETTVDGKRYKIYVHGNPFSNECTACNEYDKELLKKVLDKRGE